MSQDPPIYGGRALPNGVMMVGPGRVAVAIRRCDGTVATESSSFEPPLSRWRGVPFVRGPVAMTGMVLLAARSAKLQRSIDGDAGTRAKPLAAMVGPAIGLWVAQMLLDSAIGRVRRKPRGKLGAGSTLSPLVAFRLMALTPAGRDLLKYHGAEHMAVNAAESVEGLTVARAESQSRIHPRCGTTFAVWALLLTRFARRWVKGPVTAVIAGLAVVSLAFELLTFGARHRDEPLVQAVFGPTWRAQLLTTMEPERGHVEVAVAALEAVIGSATEPEQTSEAIP